MWSWHWLCVLVVVDCGLASHNLRRVVSQSVSLAGGAGRGSLLGSRWSGKAWVRACCLVSRSAWA
jgi:hypothetical protein